MEKEYVKGGEFLIADQAPGEIFTPEDFNDEQKMIGETTREFVDNEVRPNLEAMEKHAWEVARELVKKGGDLGLLLDPLFGGRSLLALLLGIPSGVYTALRRNSWFAQFLLTISLVGVSLPTFLIGILLIYLFSVTLGWLPSFGRGDVVHIGGWTTGFLTASGWASCGSPAATARSSKAPTAFVRRSNV